MDLLPYVAGGVALALLLVLVWWLKAPRRLPYSKRGSLLAQAEMRFFLVLVRAVPDGLRTDVAGCNVFGLTEAGG